MARDAVPSFLSPAGGAGRAQPGPGDAQSRTVPSMQSTQPPPIQT
ncbi:MAG: hypothetical protein GAK38_03465 [Xylophilus sp.]|nr:MAG: hypothetical protein GAK38_03465 [Xylophilus sp.]